MIERNNCLNLGIVSFVLVAEILFAQKEMITGILLFGFSICCIYQLKIEDKPNGNWIPPCILFLHSNWKF